MVDFVKLQTEFERIAAEAGGNWGIVLHDLQGAGEIAIRADEPFYAASVIKLPIMAAVFAAAAAGEFRLSDTLVLEAEDQVTGSGVLQALSPGIRLPIQDYVTLMIIQSDNTATNVLIDLVGVEAVNQLMAQHGLTGSRLYNKLQVVPAQRAGSNTITAGDMARLLVAIAEGRVVSWDACRRMVAILKAQQVNDSLPALLPAPASGPVGAQPAWELAHKTGAVTATVHDVGIFYLPGASFVLACLSTGQPDVRRLRTALAQMGRAAYDAYGGRG